MRVVVSGGRLYRDETRVHEVLGSYEITELAEGEATGADMLAKAWAHAHGIPVKEFPADWLGPCTNMCRAGHRRRSHVSGKTFCPAAGTYRNQDMLDEFQPDLVIAFPGGAGTADMIRRARAQLGPERVILVSAVAQLAP